MVVGTQLTDDFLQIRAGVDQAFFQGLGKYLLEAEAQGRKTPGLRTELDHEFIADHIVEATGLSTSTRFPPSARWSPSCFTTRAAAEIFGGLHEDPLALVASLRPLGAIVVIEYEHLCMSMRGSASPGRRPSRPQSVVNSACRLPAPRRGA